jgi:dipeptidyl aminopeptidase/acylaminoacyl peptidase
MFTSVSKIREKLDDFELYSLDLQNSSLLSKLTENEAIETDLQLSTNGKQVLFRVVPPGSTKTKSNSTQTRLYSIDLVNRQIIQLGEHFHGNIVGYATKSDGGVYILGQLGTEVHIYTQQSSIENLIHHNGWNGTYESLVSSNNNNLIAFVHSSFDKPMEVYLIENIDQLQLAQPITNDNELFTQRNLPQGTVYSWKNEDDHQMIEGLLHYPSGQFQSKN